MARRRNTLGVLASFCVPTDLSTSLDVLPLSPSPLPPPYSARGESPPRTRCPQASVPRPTKRSRRLRSSGGRGATLSHLPTLGYSLGHYLWLKSLFHLFCLPCQASCYGLAMKLASLWMRVLLWAFLGRAWALSDSPGKQNHVILCPETREATAKLSAFSDCRFQRQRAFLVETRRLWSPYRGMSGRLPAKDIPSTSQSRRPTSSRGMCTS